MERIHCDSRDPTWWFFIFFLFFLFSFFEIDKASTMLLMRHQFTIACWWFIFLKLGKSWGKLDYCGNAWSTHGLFVCHESCKTGQNIDKKFSKLALPSSSCPLHSLHSLTFFIFLRIKILEKKLSWLHLVFFFLSKGGNPQFFEGPATYGFKKYGDGGTCSIRGVYLDSSKSAFLWVTKVQKLDETGICLAWAWHVQHV